ncbi:hypothetical protein E2C01_089783 [Portunus trituberculatus]|uniref:Uncharacterized protein n=1 Tax=Portunus trituberculatus TaxID=210409 RepID=A0A5B7JK18_PORTR|nr:hypothetical protein [Portunus trituberculatus]
MASHCLCSNSGVEQSTCHCISGATRQ